MFMLFVQRPGNRELVIYTLGKVTSHLRVVCLGL